ncbi:Phospholipase/carboxylesterase [Podospora didyma]|uniref:Phospholipase/carboxylesterase n=1 Tax=Podospora didyma TaxID=330526 RepID=A0AAE0NRZ7_9PEZI|nr:Phospholipase/carboxylesterase [Podospora didyma]
MEIPFIAFETTKPHTNTVVFLDGRGDRNTSFSRVVTKGLRDSQGRTILEALPSIRWVFSQAPMRKCASSPKTWPQWFDVGPDKVVLAATSVYTLFNLNIPAAEGGGRLAALLGFSGRCPFYGHTLEQMREVLALEDVPQGDDNEVIRNRPILLEHCADDPLVLVQNGRGLRDVLTAFGGRVKWKEYPVGGTLLEGQL